MSTVRFDDLALLVLGQRHRSSIRPQPSSWAVLAAVNLTQVPGGVKQSGPAALVRFDPYRACHRERGGGRPHRPNTMCGRMTGLVSGGPARTTSAIAMSRPSGP